MARVISAHEATIKTATIEVKALTLSKRQVTLSVFRQLKDDPLIDEATVELHGVPWGTVNYHPDKCADSSTHVHVVWQKGDELRRALVYRRPDLTARHSKLLRLGQKLAKAYAFSLAASGRDVSAAPDLVFDLQDEYAYHRPVSEIEVYTTGDRTFGITIDGEERRHLRILLNWENHRPQREEYTEHYSEEQGEYVPTSDDDFAAIVATKFARYSDPLLTIARDLSGRDDPDHLKGVLGKVAQTLVDFEQRWRAQYAALEALDQLFIAI